MQELRGFPAQPVAHQRTTRGLLAGRPVEGWPGALYLPTDAAECYQDDGLAWYPFGPLYPATSPVNDDFSWVNQGDASVDTAHGGIAIVAPASGSLNMRIRIKTAPATPYTITALVLGCAIVQANTGYECGICFRESSSGKLAALQLEPVANGTYNVKTHKFNSPTSFNSNYVLGGVIPGLIWLRIADDGTSRITSVSADGINFLQQHTIGRTDFLTADQVGFYCRATPTTGNAMRVLSWVQS